MLILVVFLTREAKETRKWYLSVFILSFVLEAHYYFMVPGQQQDQLESLLSEMPIF